ADRRPPTAGSMAPPLHSCTLRRSVIDAAKEKPMSQDELVRLFSVLSHDLKSPLFAIDGFSELLLADYAEKLDEEGQDFLKRIRGCAQQVKRVIDDMSHVVKVLARPSIRKPTPLSEIGGEVIQKHNYA